MHVHHVGPEEMNVLIVCSKYQLGEMELTRRFVTGSYLDVREHRMQWMEDIFFKEIIVDGSPAKLKITVCATAECDDLFEKNP